jgi:transposase-like protein
MARVVSQLVSQLGDYQGRSDRAKTIYNGYRQARTVGTVKIAPRRSAGSRRAEEDLLAFYRFPAAHWSKLRSTNNIERVNKEIARRSERRRDLPNDRAVIGALLIEQNEWLLTGESVTPQLAT